MILKNTIKVLGADYITIYETKARLIRVEGLPKRCLFAVHRAIEGSTCNPQNYPWVVSEYISSYIMGKGHTPEEAIKNAVYRFQKSPYKTNLVAFKSLCKGLRNMWLEKRIDDIPYLEPPEQMTFVKDPSLLNTIPIWKLEDV